MRRNFCQACSFARHGVKTRIAIEHTCDGANIPKGPEQPYIPAREDLDRYLARLKELWDEVKGEWLPSPNSNNTELQAKKLSNENTSGQI